MSARLKRWLLGTTSRATLVRHWRSVIVRRRYNDLRNLFWTARHDAKALAMLSIVREEFRTLEKVV